VGSVVAEAVRPASVGAMDAAGVTGADGAAAYQPSF
jgi:hypothetical protein